MKCASSKSDGPSEQANERGVLLIAQERINLLKLKQIKPNFPPLEDRIMHHALSLRCPTARR